MLEWSLKEVTIEDYGTQPTNTNKQHKTKAEAHVTQTIRKYFRIVVPSISIYEWTKIT